MGVIGSWGEDGVVGRIEVVGSEDLRLKGLVKTPSGVDSKRRSSPSHSTTIAI